ncbi:MAG: hypothetical protein ACHQQQ_14020 [Bacteroidota bacterium]
MHLESIISPIGRQVEFLEKLSAGLKTLKHTDIVYKDNAIRFDYLLSLPQIDLFNALVYGWGKKKDLRRGYFNDIFNILNSFDKLGSLNKETYDNFGKEYKEYFGLFNRANDQIQRSFDEFSSLASRVNVKPIDDPFLSGFDNIVSHYQQTRQGEDPQYLIDHYIEPLKELAVEYSEDPRAIKILPIILQSKAANENRTHLMKLVSDHFEMIAKTMKDKATNLNDALKIWK